MRLLLLQKLHQGLSSSPCQLQGDFGGGTTQHTQHHLFAKARQGRAQSHLRGSFCRLQAGVLRKVLRQRKPKIDIFSQFVTILQIFFVQIVDITHVLYHNVFVERPLRL